MLRWGRHIRLTIESSGEQIVIDAPAGVERQLSIEFDLVTEAAYPFPQGTVSVYNLAARTRGILEQEEVEVSMEAGYIDLDPFGLLYRGTVDRVEHVWEGLDRRTDIHTGITGAFATIYEATYEAAVDRLTVIQDAAREADIVLDASVAANLSGQTDEGYRFEPDIVANLFTEIFSDAGLYWVPLPDGAVTVMPQDATGSVTHTISEASGMVGYPTIARDDVGLLGLEVTTLIDPRIRLDEAVMVHSEYVPEITDTQWRPTSIRHTGSNFGDTYYTTVNGRAV